VDKEAQRHITITDEDKGDQTFQTRVLNFISGYGDQEPSNVGPSVDWNWFNKANDNSWLIIHTPAVWNWDAAKGHEAHDKQYGNIDSLRQSYWPP